MNILTVIGAGSLGSVFLSTALICGKMSNPLGFRKIYICDFDDVEPHNLRNQIYRFKDIGKFKVAAMKDIIQPFSEADIIPVRKQIYGDSRISGVTIVMVDDMWARKEIFKLCRYRADVPFYIDARTGLNEAYVVGFDPRDPDCVARYEKTLYTQSQGVAAPCADARSIPTLWTVAGIVEEFLSSYKKRPRSIDDRIKALVAATIGRILVVLRTSEVHDSGEFFETVVDFNNLPFLQTKIFNLSFENRR